VTTSSTAAPDIGAICRAALGGRALAWDRIGKGRNSRVFRVDLDGVDRGLPLRVVVKFYRRDPGDSRDRLSTEFESLSFLKRHDIATVPTPIAIARDAECAIYQYIDGEVAMATPIREHDVDVSVAFLHFVKLLRGEPDAAAIAPASEACFTLEELASLVDGRLARLRRAPAAGDEAASLAAWIDRTLAPMVAEVQQWSREAARRDGVRFDEPLPQRARTLSPSDFGFHNAIRRPDGTLVFVDFEYFGWDDPAKMIADYLLHPGMALDDALKRRFAAGVLGAFDDVPSLRARVRIVYPLFAVKWALILLNDFLPERIVASTSGHLASQLAKAQAFIEDVAGRYARNPFLS